MSLSRVCIMALIVGTARAQDAPPAPSKTEPLSVTSASLLWENDGRFYRLANDSDRWYTNGLELDITFNRPFPAFSERLLPFAGFYDDPATAGGLVIGQQIFTPEDISTPDLQFDDRPYAGYLYAGLYVQRSDQLNMDHLELDIGVVGSWSFAEDTQKAVHAALPSQVKPAGWDNQLANELGVTLTYEHRWRTPTASLGDIQFDAIAGLGGRLGNVHTDINASLTARVGYNLPDDFGPPTIDSFRDATGTWGGDFGVYGYARVKGQAVARNIFLDGNTFANSHSIDKEPLVGSLQLGVMLRYKWFETGWSTTWRTEQFVGQNGIHGQGAWYAAARFVY